MPQQEPRCHGLTDDKGCCTESPEPDIAECQAQAQPDTFPGFHISWPSRLQRQRDSARPVQVGALRNKRRAQGVQPEPPQRRSSSLEQSLGLAAHLVSRHTLSQSLVHFVSSSRCFSQPQLFDLGLGQRVKARKKLFCQRRPFLDRKRQRFSTNDFGVHGRNSSTARLFTGVNIGLAPVEKLDAVFKPLTRHCMTLGREELDSKI